MQYLHKTPENKRIDYYFYPKYIKKNPDKFAKCIIIYEDKFSNNES